MYFPHQFLKFLNVLRFDCGSNVEIEVQTLPEQEHFWQNQCQARCIKVFGKILPERIDIVLDGFDDALFLTTMQ